jgi:8-oxo-dGTP diphosphatase
MDEPVQLRVACKALIARDGKVLVLRESGKYEEGTNVGKYDMPGGRITPGEPLVEALQREALEESGLTVTVGKPIHVAEWRPIVKGVQLHIVGIYFICEASGEVKLSQDHDDFKWIDPAEAAGYPLMYSVLDAVNKWSAAHGR